MHCESIYKIADFERQRELFPNFLFFFQLQQKEKNKTINHDTDVQHLAYLLSKVGPIHLTALSHAWVAHLAFFLALKIAHLFPCLSMCTAGVSYFLWVSCSLKWEFYPDGCQLNSSLLTRLTIISESVSTTSSNIMCQ